MSLKDWSPPSLPSRAAIQGRYVQLEPVEREHVAGLMEAFAEDASGRMWAYLPHGPFDHAGFVAWVDAARASPDPLHYAVRMEDGLLGGTLSLMRIKPAAGSIETGWLTFAPRLQRTREATEAVYQLMRWSFEAGYRRFEWKASFGRRRSSREGIATPLGTRALTANGQRSRRRLRLGSHPRTLTLTECRNRGWVT